MRPAPELTIRPAGPDDIAALMDSESRYYAGNLDPGERADGVLSILHSAQWFIDTVRAGGIHVAESDGATTTKLGAQVLAEFKADGRHYHLLAYPFDDHDGSTEP